MNSISKCIFNTNSVYFVSTNLLSKNEADLVSIFTYEAKWNSVKEYSSIYVSLCICVTKTLLHTRKVLDWLSGFMWIKQSCSPQKWEPAWVGHCTVSIWLGFLLSGNERGNKKNKCFFLWDFMIFFFFFQRFTWRSFSSSAASVTQVVAGCRCCIPIAFAVQSAEIINFTSL